MVQVIDKETKRSANLIAGKAKHDGILVPEPCVVCRKKDLPVVMHHPDYTKPLDIVWLCYSCHIREHKKEHPSPLPIAPKRRAYTDPYKNLESFFEYMIQVDYGNWEEMKRFSTYALAKAALPRCRELMPGAEFRIRKIRKPRQLFAYRVPV